MISIIIRCIDYNDLVANDFSSAPPPPPQQPTSSFLRLPASAHLFDSSQPCPPSEDTAKLLHYELDHDAMINLRSIDQVHTLTLSLHMEINMHDSN